LKATLLVHAGAGTWRLLNIGEVIKVVKNALIDGFTALKRGSAIDGVVAATKILEDSGILNAGLGSVVDVSGNISMDAGLMDGFSGRVGAVAAVTYPKNPILLARKVMELTDHILLVGKEADNLAMKLGLEKHPGPSKRIVERYHKLLLQGREKLNIRYGRSFRLAEELGIGDTVGAVAVDPSGRVAAAVSTGGVMLKFPGRVGDSAIPGAGFYASKRAAAVATGIGETIISTFLTLRTVEYIGQGLTPETAVKWALMRHTSLQGPNTAGVIAITSSGDYSAGYNTEAMPWGVMREGMKGPKVLGLPK